MKRFFLIFFFGLFLITSVFSQTKAVANPYLRIDRLMDIPNDSITSLPALGAYINATYVITRNRGPFFTGLHKTFAMHRS